MYYIGQPGAGDHGAQKLRPQWSSRRQEQLH